MLLLSFLYLRLGCLVSCKFIFMLSSSCLRKSLIYKEVIFFKWKYLNIYFFLFIGGNFTYNFISCSILSKLQLKSLIDTRFLTLLFRSYLTSLGSPLVRSYLGESTIRWIIRMGLLLVELLIWKFCNQLLIKRLFPITLFKFC